MISYLLQTLFAMKLLILRNMKLPLQQLNKTKLSYAVLVMLKACMHARFSASKWRRCEDYRGGFSAFIKAGMQLLTPLNQDHRDGKTPT